MNKVWKKHFKALIWKESIEGWRKNRLFIPVTIIFVVILQYIPVAQVVNNNQMLLSQKNLILGVITMYIPLMVIPFLGTNYFSRSIYEEKINRSIHILLASGISPLSIWTGKFFIAVAYSYLTSIVSVFTYFLFIKFYVGESMLLTSQTIILTLISMPIAAIGVLALIGWSFWALKSPQIIGFIVPIVSVLGTWNFVINFGLKYPVPIVIFISLVIGVVLIGFVIFTIRLLPNERIIDVGQ